MTPIPDKDVPRTEPRRLALVHILTSTPRKPGRVDQPRPSAALQHELDLLRMRRCRRRVGPHGGVHVRWQRGAAKQRVDERGLARVRYPRDGDDERCWVASLRLFGGELGEEREHAGGTPCVVCGDASLALAFALGLCGCVGRGGQARRGGAEEQSGMFLP